jgi:5-methylcytosine-specific restriction endonuclease McrA
MFLCESDCHYCGAHPSNVKKIKSGNGEFIYNGIDRINSSGPYSILNCVTCCEQCNKAKLDYSVKEFKDWIERVYNHQFVTPNLGY